MSTLLFTFRVIKSCTHWIILDAPDYPSTGRAKLIELNWKGLSPYPNIHLKASLTFCEVRERQEI